MTDQMFGVTFCTCDEDLQERELVDEVVFCANCEGVIAYHVSPVTVAAELEAKCS